MSNIGKPERETQNRVIALLHDELGYRYLGNWSDRANNSNIVVSHAGASPLRNGELSPRSPQT